MSDLLQRIDLRFDHVSEKLSQHSISEDGCWEYQGHIHPDGYGKLLIYSSIADPKRRVFRAHRVAYAYHYGVDPGAMLVCHKCDNPCCINPDHLFLGTPLDNTRDMHQKGRAHCQEGNNNSARKIDEDVVESVVALIMAGRSNKQIALKLPVSHSQVSLIRLGKSWRKTTEALGYNPDHYRVFRRAS